MEKPKIELSYALEKAEEILATLQPHCLKIQIAGSIRRKKPMVGDIEILYIPKPGTLHLPGDLMPTEVEDLCEEALKTLIESQTLSLRKKVDGTTAFGKKTKLLEISASQTPLDLFRCTPENWFNNLVSRTGGKENNILIAGTALKNGLEWQAFGNGFLHTATQKLFPVLEEKDAFEIVGLPYKPPEERR